MRIGSSTQALAPVARLALGVRDRDDKPPAADERGDDTERETPQGVAADIVARVEATDGRTASREAARLRDTTPNLFVHEAAVTFSLLFQQLHLRGELVECLWMDLEELHLRSSARRMRASTASHATARHLSRLQLRDALTDLGGPRLTEVDGRLLEAVA
ncbi:MAG: hypothetical protein M5U28_55510, partial [Sandaracinaceae bacterium]|nr:hypothetical protein [Sandaracinaceae bacterium]